MIVIQAEITAPVRQGFKLFLVFIFIAKAGHIVTAPVADDLRCAAFVGFLGQNRHERAAFDRRVDDENLIFLQMNAFL